MRIDLHVHTSYSPDATLKPAELVERARRAGLDRVAVTDHNRMDGAYAAHALDPSLIILGEEVDCEDGTHLIGLFIHEPIPKGLSIEEVAACIREQGGVVYAPHPFAYLRGAALKAARLLAVADIVEAFNGRAFLPVWNQRALSAAGEKGLRVGAGSDGHFPHEIGGVWTEVPAFSTPGEFMAAMSSARLCHTRQSGPFAHIASFSLEAIRSAGARMIGRRPHGAPVPEEATAGGVR